MNDFNTREEYLAAVAQWKADYEQLTKDIRAAKQGFRIAMSDRDKHGMYNWKEGYSSEFNKKFNALDSVVNSARSDRGNLKQRATDMLEERAAAKKEAQRQYEASRT